MARRGAQSPSHPPPRPPAIAYLAPHRFLGIEVEAGGGGAGGAGVKIHKDSQTETQQDEHQSPRRTPPSEVPSSWLLAFLKICKKLFYVVAPIPYTQQLAVWGTSQISDCGNKISLSGCLCGLLTKTRFGPGASPLLSSIREGARECGAEEKGAQVLGKAY